MIQPAKRNGLIANALQFLALAFMTILLTSCPGKPSPPKRDIGSVTIQVLDRFGNPIPEFDLEMKREYRKAMSMQPYEEVGRATTNAEGIAEFPEVKEGDWVSENHDGYRFSGTATMEFGKSEYVLKMNHTAIGSTSYGPEVSIDRNEDDVERITDTLNKILAYYVDQELTEFSSLNFYVEQGVISRTEANQVLKMSHRMNRTPSGINFYWGGVALRVADDSSDLVWVED